MDDTLSSISTSRHVASTIHRSAQALRFLGDQVNTVGLNKYWREKLLASVDGGELGGVGLHRSDMQWARLEAKTSGEDFIHHTAVRINNIPSRDRTTRGRKGQASVATTCRGGCPDPETTYHTIQVCYRSKGMRMERHNRAVDLLEKGLQKRGFQVAKEKRIATTGAGAKQPDLIAVKDGRATVIDVQVVNGQGVDAAHVGKMWKYRGIPGFDGDVRTKYGVSEVVHMPCTITYRGAWAERSVAGLVELGVSAKTLHMVVTSVLRGSWMCWRLFNAVGGGRRTVP